MWRKPSLGFGPVFCPKLGEDQKKGLRSGWDRVLRPNSLQVQSQSSHILIANANGGDIFAFSAKIGIKSNKNRVFCILCMPIGRPNPPPHKATLLLSAIRIGIFPFNSSSIALVSFCIDLRKKKGKMPILAAKSRPCECIFRYILLKAVAKREPVGPRPFLEML